MGLLSSLRNKLARSPTRPPAPQSSRAHQSTARREAIRTALRRTILHHALPVSCLGAQLWFPSPSERQRGIHVRLLIRESEPEVLSRALAFETDFLRQLASCDPGYHSWFGSITWQFLLTVGNDVATLPVFTFRAQQKAARPKHQPQPESTRQQIDDLNRMFSSTETASGTLSSARHAASGFADTQPIARGSKTKS